MIDCPGCWAHSVPFTGVGPQVWWLDEHTESHITLTRLVAPSIVVFVTHFIGLLWPGAQGHLTSPCSVSQGHSHLTSPCPVFQGHKVIWPLPVPSLRGTRSFDLSLFLLSGAQGHLTSPCSLSQGHKFIWSCFLSQHYSVITLKMSLIFVYMFCFMYVGGLVLRTDLRRGLYMT